MDCTSERDVSHKSHVEKPKTEGETDEKQGPGEISDIHHKHHSPEFPSATVPREGRDIHPQTMDTGLRTANGELPLVSGERSSRAPVCT